MSKAWKTLALLLVITVLVWLTTLWRWQSTQMNPSASDIVVHLVLMPIALTAALVLTIWFIKRLRAYAAAPIVAKPAAGAASATDASPSTRQQPSSFKVLASTVLVRAGTDWAGAQDVIQSGDCKPELDALLKDENGTPVFTAALPDVASDLVNDSINELLPTLRAQQPELWNGFECPPDVSRALALMEASVGGMREALATQWEALNASLNTTINASRPGPATGSASAAGWPMATIRVGIPSRWSAASQQIAQAWLGQLFEPVISAGLQAAGQSSAMAKSVQPAVQLHVHAVDTSEAFWLLADQQLQQWQRGGEAGLLLAIAADSLVSEGNVDSLGTAQELFSGSNQRGRVPGEGSAALLLASPHWPELPHAEPASARMHLTSLMRRDKAADAQGRISSATLLQATGDALKGSGHEAPQIGYLTSDVDHRGTRTGELFEVLQELLPHLDTNSDVLRLGVGCGDLGISRLLACLALSATQVQSKNKPTLVLGNFSAFDRFAVVLSPAAAAPGTAALLPAA
jgi:hypothetical protein